MKLYKSKSASFVYLLYRLIRPIIDPLHMYQGIIGYFWYIRDIFLYKKCNPKASLINANLFPVLDEKITYTPFDGHYFYQQIWAFSHILKQRPEKHVDVASTYELSGYLSAIVPTTFIDLRPIPSQLPNLSIKKGDILNLPYTNDSVQSLSCLHVVEHIGLGRYGDPIDPEGTEKSCHELMRILAHGGKLYFSTPVGRERICFNAHRIHPPEKIIAFFKTLTLIEFSVVDDENRFIQKTDYRGYDKADYACGMFVFTKQ